MPDTPLECYCNSLRHQTSDHPVLGCIVVGCDCGARRRAVPTPPNAEAVGLELYRTAMNALAEAVEAKYMPALQRDACRVALQMLRLAETITLREESGRA